MGRSVHLGQIKGGLRHSAKRIAQGATVKVRKGSRFFPKYISFYGLTSNSLLFLQLTTTSKLPMQIDGEPWMQAACALTIDLFNKQPMLQRAVRRLGGV